MENRFCRKCGTALEANASFCGKCGTKVDYPQPGSFIITQPKRPPTLAIFMIVFGLGVLAYTISTSSRSKSDSPSLSNESSNVEDSESKNKTTSVRKKKTASHTSNNKTINRSVSKPSKSEIDSPSDFAYTSHKVRCPSTNFVQQFREQAIKVDELIRSGITSFTIEEENQLGQETLGKIESALGGRLTQQGVIAQYISDVGNGLTFDLKRPQIQYQFYLLEDTTMENALALPGGHVIITRAMFDNWIENEAQLATILGHEIAHIDNKHVIAAYQFAKSIHPEASNNELVMILLQILSRGLYSVEREAEADAYGAIKLHQKGYSTFQSVQLWENQIKTSEPVANGNGLFGQILEEVLENGEELLASHPGADVRSCRLKQHTYTLYKDDPIQYPYIGTKNYIKRRSKSNKTY